MLSGQGRRRDADRIDVALDVALIRPHGNPVAARTINVSDHGMRISCRRPLSVDEVLGFDLVLEAGERHVDGRVRVVREHAGNVYALRVEQLGDPSALLLAQVSDTGRAPRTAAH